MYSPNSKINWIKSYCAIQSVDKMADWKEQYFGSELLTKDGMRPTKDVLAAVERIAVYFSAHWCPPCRGFTPVLATFFEDLVQQVGNKKVMIIFVSSDNDESEFNKYFETMPWCSVPYNNDEKRRDLSAKFEIRGIPSLIVLDGVDASVVDKDGRTTVASGRGDVDKVYAQWAPPVV